MVDLNSLIPSDLGWELVMALDINNSGQIMGYGFVDNNFHTFVLTPHKNEKQSHAGYRKDNEGAKRPFLMAH